MHHYFLSFVLESKEIETFNDIDHKVEAGQDTNGSVDVKEEILSQNDAVDKMETVDEVAVKTVSPHTHVKSSGRSRKRKPQKFDPPPLKVDPETMLMFPYGCEFCSRRFKNRGNYVQHRRVHAEAGATPPPPDKPKRRSRELLATTSAVKSEYGAETKESVDAKNKMLASFLGLYAGGEALRNLQGGQLMDSSFMANASNWTEFASHAMRQNDMSVQYQHLLAQQALLSQYQDAGMLQMYAPSKSVSESTTSQTGKGACFCYCYSNLGENTGFHKYGGDTSANFLHL